MRQKSIAAETVRNDANLDRSSAPTGDKTPALRPERSFQASSTTTTTSSSFARRDRGKLELLGRIQESIIDIVSRPASREKFREYLESVAHRESSAPTQDFGGRVAVADQPLTALAFFSRLRRSTRDLRRNRGSMCMPSLAAMARSLPPKASPFSWLHATLSQR